MIYLVQLLCPARHCIIAAAYDSERGGSFDDTVRLMEARLEQLGAHPWCCICGAEHLTFEQAKAKFPDMATALPILRAAEASNLATRQRLAAEGNSFDSTLWQ